MMTMPTPLCPNQMQVHSIHQETPDVWTISLICHDFYRYHPGQYALVSIRDSEETLRAYTLSSSPGQSKFITISVRCLPDGEGSRWLTQEVHPGQQLWLSDAQGEFTCANAPADRYLMLAAGCGVTPIMSMTRWLLANRPEAHVQVIFNVRTPRDVIFANEWRDLDARYSQLKLTLMAESEATTEFLTGRITRETLEQICPDIASRTVMTCGPAPYMKAVKQLALDLGVPAQNFYQEQFQVVVDNDADGATLKLTTNTPLHTYHAPVGATLLFAMEQNKLPIQAACRAGVCGCCKTRILSGDYTTSSTMTLTPDEIAQGYVLACSCQLNSDVVIA
jgi:NADH oxidoreductase Hcr